MPSPTIHDRFTHERHYPHSRERLFAALSNPALKQRWYSGNHMQEQAFEMDFRVGGREHQSYAMGAATPFPGLVIENDGRFEDIVEGERIVLATTMIFGGNRISTSLITFELSDEDGGSALVFNHQAVFYEGADGTAMRRAGWEALLDALAGALAS